MREDSALGGGRGVRVLTSTDVGSVRGGVYRPCPVLEGAVVPWGRIDNRPPPTGRLMPNARVGLLFEGDNPVPRQSLSVEDAPQPSELRTLEQAAAQTDRQAFALLATAIDWSTHGATALTRAIDLALALDMVSLARELAHQGNRIFPEDRRLQQAMAVLAPPVVRGTRPAQSLHLTASQRWLKEHASQYTGQWVAVRGGTLLGSAATLQELHERIGIEGQAASTIVVKVLPCASANL